MTNATPPAAILLDMYRRMVLIRRLEDRLYQLFLQGLVPGTLHQYQGQEGVAVGVCSALRATDLIFSTHRPVGHAIAKGMSLIPIAAELWGKAAGCAGGKGGQMHLTGVSVGMMPSSAIVGANIPIAVGAALGFALRGLDRVAVSFFGDGASNTGAFHEGLNLAAVRQAPVLFICENNQYGASTHISLATRIEDIADRAAGYGMPGVVVDGQDVLAVHEATLQALARARQGRALRSWSARLTATWATRGAIPVATARKMRCSAGGTGTPTSSSRPASSGTWDRSRLCWRESKPNAAPALRRRLISPGRQPSPIPARPLPLSMPPAGGCDDPQRSER